MMERIDVFRSMFVAVLFRLVSETALMPPEPTRPLLSRVDVVLL
jgi:hypothetical protein